MPSVEKLSGNMTAKSNSAKLNAAKNRRLCMKLKVMALPTILFYKGGENDKTFEQPGRQPRSDQGRG